MVSFVLKFFRSTGIFYQREIPSIRATPLYMDMFFFDWQKIRHFESRKFTKMSTRGAKRNEIT